MTLLLVFAASCTLSLILTPLARELAKFVGLVDRPDEKRKIHSRPMPVSGGIAIFFTACILLTALMLTSTPLSESLQREQSNLLGLLLGAGIICILGVTDDYRLLRGRHKLVGQIIAVLVVIQFGLVVRTIHVFDWRIELGLLAVPFTVIWLLGAINALNLIDGMDGLLSSVGLIISLAIVACAVFHDKMAVACVAVVLAGALLGFLRYNFPPASIFLGDSGSMLIGLVIGTLAIQGSLKGPATIVLATPLALLTIPFFDTIAAIIRRKLTGRSIYTTDRGHLHHCLLRRGLSNRRVLLFVSLFCLLTVSGALASLALEQEIVALLITAAVITMLIVSQLFGYAEFMLIKKSLAMLLVGFLRPRPVNGSYQTEVRLQGTADWARWWTKIIANASELNLKMVRLNVNMPFFHEGYHARWDCADGQREEGNYWRAEMPLLAQGHIIGRVEIIGERNHEPVWKKIVSVLELVDDFENDASSLVESPGQLAVVNGAPAHEGQARKASMAASARETAASEPPRSVGAGSLPHFHLRETLGEKRGPEPSHP